MDITVTLDYRTFKEFTYFDILKRRKAWKSPVTFASILTVSAVICFLMRKVDGAVLLGTVLLVVGLGMPLVYFLSFFLNVREEGKKQKLGDGREVYSLSLTEKSVKVSNKKESAEYQWNKIYMAYRNYDAIYLYITRERAFILPSEKLSQDEIWSLCEKKLKGKCEILKSNKINMRNLGTRT